MVQDNSDTGTQCKTPLGYVDGKQLASLMTLKSFVEGGHEVDNGKILVCVKSIGGRKKRKCMYDQEPLRLAIDSEFFISQLYD